MVMPLTDVEMAIYRQSRFKVGGWIWRSVLDKFFGWFVLRFYVFI